MTQPVAWMVYTLDGQSCYVTDNPTDIPPDRRALPLYTEPFPTDEALLRQALEMLELALSSHKVLLMSDPPRWAWNEYGVEGKCRATIAALRERLGEQA